MPLRSSVALAFTAAALTLTACGSEDADVAPVPDPDTGTTAPAPAPAPAPDTGTTVPPTPQDGGTGSTPGAAGAGTAGLPPRPQPDSCVDVPEALDGRYVVYEAGTAVVTREGDQLVLDEVQATEGWTARVDDEEPDEIEIDFRRDGSDVLDLEVELDDGRVEARLCADDD